MEGNKYDFTKTAINEWSVEKTPEVALAHLRFATETMEWFQGEEAKKLLLHEAYPVAYQEYELMLSKAFPLFRDFSDTASVQVLYLKVVQRGIVGLRAVAHMVAAGVRDNEEVRELIREWFNGLLYQLHPARLGVGSKFCTNEQTFELIDNLAAICVILKSEGMLARVASDRYPTDKLAQELYVAHLKNWE